MVSNTEKEMLAVEEIENGVAGLLVAPNIHTLSQGACEYVTWCSKRDFACAIKVKDLEMERLAWIGWAQFYHRSL